MAQDPSSPVSPTPAAQPRPGSAGQPGSGGLTLKADEPGITAARDAMLAGGLMLMPTETVFGLCCAVSSPAGVGNLLAARRALRGLTADEPMRPGAWLAADAERVYELITADHPVHQRLVSRLAPGPVTFIAELAPDQIAAVRSRIGCGPGIVDEADPPAVLVRVPSHALSQRVAAAMEATGSGLLADAIPVSGDKPARTLQQASTALQAAGVNIAGSIGGADAAESPRYGTASSRVRLTRAGGYIILSEGAISRSRIDGAARRHILFVCTGNTCRSPMAQAIAQAELAALGVTDIEVASAGVAAADGERPTPEGNTALNKLGIKPPTTRSQMLTPELLEAADVVYVMTRSHGQGATRMAGSTGTGAADKITLLDPAGKDVPDPIGGPQSLYDSTASHLRGLIRARLKELLA